MPIKDHGIAEKLKSAHEAVQKDLQRLEAAIRPAAGQNIETVGDLLAGLRAHLLEHFCAEEDNGYMALVRKREPRLERAVDNLAAEHAELISDLDRLLSTCQKSADPDEVLRRDVQTWTKKVRQHQTRQIDLVQDAFNLDIGTED